MQLDLVNNDAGTEVGSYFIANYPPFSAWRGEHVPTAFDALHTNPPVSPLGKGGCEIRNQEVARAEARTSIQTRSTPLGLYLHIPFCRKRCKFCYFRVYTDRNSSDVDEYLEGLARETALYAQQPALAGREFEFVYFGGGTPSFLSSDQLLGLIDRIREHWDWDHAREVTFECEPGTLKKSKLETIRAIGVTRLSLGIEHFDDDVLTIGGRAHKSAEVFRAYEWAREVGFPQINVDLIAGMVGDNDSKWRDAVAKTITLQPDSVTIYQMEVPHNTVIAHDAKGGDGSTHVPSWTTKRAWVKYAYEEFERAGYAVSSGYTLVRKLPIAEELPISNCQLPIENGVPKRIGEPSTFVYRDSLWHGADLIGMGVASFSHFQGVHYQNYDDWDEYLGPLMRGELPIARALTVTARQRLIREMILQLKTGRLEIEYFRAKFGVDIRMEFAEAFRSLSGEGIATIEGDEIRLTRDGLLRVDMLLPRFFEPQFQNVRYT
ncbi:MAG: coproporphyrinogen III oxidase family protein [Planctomycetes bacterium]|nr:coproporphyrinogen III oxidase family protein [Planctomycetota bacterium]MBI3835798.1 coproporphyrinogen III oxidase family protein [Planctomycetota bacterium]